MITLNKQTNKQTNRYVLEIFNRNITLSKIVKNVNTKNNVKPVLGYG